MSTTDSIKESLENLKDQVVGKAKEVFGSATDDHKLENEGHAQSEYGQAKQENDHEAQPTGTVSEELDGLKDRVVGNVKDAAGAVTGDERLEKEGEAQANYGKTRQENNDVV